jgi:cell division protein ZapA
VSVDRRGSSTAGPPAEGERRNSVRVSILGDEYIIRTEASAVHTRQVAEHVDRIIRQVLAAGSVVETHKAAILAALQITDELFRVREDWQRVAVSMQELSAEVKRWLPPGKRATEE